MKSIRWIAMLCGAFWAVTTMVRAEAHALVLQTDFGTKDGAVSAMRGVAFGVSPTLPIFDLSHENTPFDTWEAAYRLNQTAAFWPAGTVFVSVIDPGVGTERRAVVLKTKSGHYFVGPDNGSWTLVAESLGVAAVRLIDETKNRRPGSERSYTFHGRDVFAYVGAKLASGLIPFEGVGPLLEPKVVALSYEKAKVDHGMLTGNIPYLDFQYGNIWTNIDETLFAEAHPSPAERFKVTFLKNGETVFEQTMPYTRTFGDVPVGQPLLYLNSLMNVAIALNQGNFAQAHGIGYGAAWSVRIEKMKP
jgi:S-adenosylmethionine hydrolase